MKLYMFILIFLPVFSHFGNSNDIKQIVPVHMNNIPEIINTTKNVNLISFTDNNTTFSENNIKPFINRCCDYKLKTGENNCSIHDESIDLNNIVLNDSSSSIVQVPNDYFQIVHEKKCSSVFPIFRNESVWFLLLNGTLYFPNSTEFHSIIKPDEFCVNYYKDVNTSFIEIFMCYTIEIQEAAKEKQVPFIVKIGMLISMPFLMVTFFVYACVPELQNIHGKCLMCYVVTLFVAYIFLVSVQLSPGKGTYCVTAPFIIYFAFMVSFMWLNVMCVDICWTFSGRRGFKGSVRQSERKRFIAYSIYAWGVPFAMLCIALGLQFGPNIPNYIIKPRFGEGKCWFADDKALSLYFYGPILLIIVVNLGLFSYTALKIWNVQKDTDQSMKHESQRHGNETDKQSPKVRLMNAKKFQYKLYLKLMLVFGVNWLMEIISWLISGPKWLWYITDMCNALYGVFIFFIFVCKANVWKLVRKRYHVMMGRPYLASTYGPTSSTRSTGISHSTANPPGNGTGPDSFALTSSTAA